MRPAGRIGVDEEAVVLGAFAVASTGLRLGEAGAHHCRFEVVGHYALGYAAEAGKGVLVTEQPGRLTLVEDQLGVEVAAEGQHHDEDPGLAHRAAARIESQPRVAEVHLCLGARRDLDPHHRSLSALCGTYLCTEALEQTPDGAVANRVAMPLFQPDADCGSLQAPSTQGGDFIPIGFYGRALLGWWEGGERGSM